MAGDWIKMSRDLRTHPKVVRIASALKADKLRVVGGLHAIWCIFDAHSTDGSLPGYSLAALDEELGWKGFSRALVTVEWLEEGDDAVRVPRYDTHNGASAKRRAQESERKRLSRTDKDESGTSVRRMSASRADKSVTREEKRREEKKDLPQASSGVDPAAEPDLPLPTTDVELPIDPIHARACEIAALLRRRGGGVTAADPRVRAWAANPAATDAQLLAALDTAKAAREKSRDPTAINAGYLDTILGNQIAGKPVYDLDALAKATA